MGKKREVQDPNASDTNYVWHFDMLNDASRCKWFRREINIAVSRLRKQKQAVQCIDIGSGSGLLGLLAMQAGADQITCIEMDEGLAEKAQANVKRNGSEDKMHVLHSHSTALTRGDLPRPCRQPGLGRHEIHKLALGDEHVLALTAVGLVLAWGRNDSGQLGTGDRADQPSPVRLRHMDFTGGVAVVGAVCKLNPADP